MVGWTARNSTIIGTCSKYSGVTLATSLSSSIVDGSLRQYPPVRGWLIFRNPFCRTNVASDATSAAARALGALAAGTTPAGSGAVTSALSGVPELAWRTSSPVRGPARPGAAERTSAGSGATLADPSRSRERSKGEGSRERPRGLVRPQWTFRLKLAQERRLA